MLILLKLFNLDFVKIIFLNLNSLFELNIDATCPSLATDRSIKSGLKLIILL